MGCPLLHTLERGSVGGAGPRDGLGPGPRDGLGPGDDPLVSGTGDDPLVSGTGDDEQLLPNPREQVQFS